MPFKETRNVFLSNPFQIIRLPWTLKKPIHLGIGNYLNDFKKMQFHLYWWKKKVWWLHYTKQHTKISKITCRSPILGNGSPRVTYSNKKSWMKMNVSERSYQDILLRLFNKVVNINREEITTQQIRWGCNNTFKRIAHDRSC